MASKSRTCRECGAGFEPNHGHERICSDECRRQRANKLKAIWNAKARAKRMPTSVDCLECKTTFKPTHASQRVCSDKCRRTRNHRKSTKSKNERRAIRRELGLCAHCAKPSPKTVVCHECQPLKGPAGRTKYPVGTECARCGKVRQSTKEKMTHGYCGNCYVNIRSTAKREWIRQNPEYLLEYALQEIRRP